MNRLEYQSHQPYAGPHEPEAWPRWVQLSFIFGASMGCMLMIAAAIWAVIEAVKSVFG